MAKTVNVNNGQTPVDATPTPTSTPTTDGIADGMKALLALRGKRLAKSRLSHGKKVKNALLKATVLGAEDDKAFGRHTLSALLAASDAAMEADLNEDAEFETEAVNVFSLGEQYMMRTMSALSAGVDAASAALSAGQE